MNNNSIPKIKYFLLAKLSTTKVLYDCMTINDPQTLYESQEILIKFNEKKIFSRDKIRIKSRDSFYYITVDQENYFFLVYGIMNLRADEAFSLIEKVNSGLKDKYGMYYTIDEIDAIDQQNITNAISSHNNYSFRKETKIRINTENFNITKSVDVPVKKVEVLGITPSGNVVVNNRYDNVVEVLPKSSSIIEGEVKAIESNNMKESIPIEKDKSKEEKVQEKIIKIENENMLLKSKTSQPSIKKENLLMKSNTSIHSKKSNIVKESDIVNIKALNKTLLNLDDETNSTTELPPLLKGVALTILILAIIIPIMVISIVLSKSDEF